MRVDMTLLELSVLLLELPLNSRLHIRVIEVFVPLLDGEHDLAALVSKFDSFLAIAIFIC